MRRTFLILASGVLAAVLAQSVWFQVRSPGTPSSDPRDIAWLKNELRLSDEQFARIAEIHNNQGPRIAALASQVAHMKTEMEAFESQRRDTGEIDFLEFARFVEMRRAIDRECMESTRNVVQASAGQMTPAQRTRYLEMISPIIRDLPSGKN